MHLSPETRADIARRVRSVAEVRDVWLCGSQARGEATAASDIDLVVVIQPGAARTTVGVAVRRRLWGLPYGFDLMLLTETEWQALRGSRAWFDRQLVHDAQRLDAVA
jgi:predicted nucleotidyltransferase